MFTSLFGSTPTNFLCITVIFMGGCAVMAGQALGRTWRPLWHALPYSILLGGADRFLVFALFDGTLISLPGYLLDSATLLLLVALSHRATLAGQMTNQYPWLYKRVGWFRWEERIGQQPSEM
jgi:branched-chain amino acid transport system ATP-binding protein